MTIGKIKSTITDFVVSEAMVLDINSKGDHCRYMLKKAGFTTFEAINHIAAALEINTADIGYAGLKDEDGITTQNISMPIELNFKRLEQFNSNNKSSEGKFLSLVCVDKGIAPIQIGRLCGNNFYLVIRQLDERIATRIQQTKKHQIFFINYYGPQRFGLPNATKNTHLIGENLINQKYSEAAELLGVQPNEVGEKARGYNGDKRLFFGELDSRLVAFYQSAFYSHLWNEKLKQKISTQDNNFVKYEQEGILYFFPRTLGLKLDLIKDSTHLPYTRVVPKEDVFNKCELPRPILIQANITSYRVFEDLLNPGSWACDIMFFLPTGCYATMVIPQFLQSFQDMLSS